MRRILRKIASGDKSIGDTTTLADPSVVELYLKTDLRNWKRWIVDFIGEN